MSEMDRLRDDLFRLAYERDRWQAKAEQRMAMRREFEELLDVNPDASYSEAEFDHAVAVLREMKATLFELKSLVREVASSPVEYDNHAAPYLLVQIDRELWDEIIKRGSE